MTKPITLRLHRTLAALLLTGSLALGAVGCGGPEQKSASGPVLMVYAAASLKGAFEDLGQEFQDTHGGVKVEFNFAGSSDLVAQIQQGAPADVFASADEANMAKLSADELDSRSQVFATNTLEIAVPLDNPAEVTTFADLAKPGVQVVVCAPEVPCGAAAEKVATTAGVTLKPVSEEQSVTDVLNKVIAGEADAGLVYVTDVKAADDKVLGVPFAESKEVVNSYPIAPLAGAGNVMLAKEFVDLVLSSKGQSLLRGYGFGQP